MSLMDQILRARVPAGQLAAWWLGQNSFIFKSPGGVLLGVDLYLSDFCAGRHPELDLRRRIPVLIQPEDLRLDVFATTHNHCDHTDPETLRRMRHRQQVRFIGPHPSCEVFARYGASPEQITPAWPGCRIPIADLVLHGVFALPTDDSDLNHLGYVVELCGGTRVYITGDTDDHELLASARRHHPEVMIVCINGGFNNLSHWEAARLAARIQPRVAIPCHWDLFPDNAIDPEQFRAALKVVAPQVRYARLVHGQGVLLPEIQALEEETPVEPAG